MITSHKFYHTAVRIFAGCFLLFSLNSCALYDKFFGEDTEMSPEELMALGISEAERGRYESAAEAFQNIRDRYPYSKFAVEAELKMADTLYKADLFDEAYDAYDEFEKLHPKNPNIPYVIYQKGMCHFRQMSTIDRDQSHTYLAKEEFERLVKKFPKDKYANMAQINIRKCYISLAKHELYVGDYYFKVKKYRTAMGRYRYLLENYPDFGKYYEALSKLRDCKEKIDNEQKRP